MTQRPPAVAGRFYPGTEAALRGQLRELLGDDPEAPPSPPPRALIVPHAGYVFSGATAALAYRRLAPVRDRIRRVLLLGPAHRVYLRSMAVPSASAFVTPLGAVPVDTAARDGATALPGVCIDDAAHVQEHSLEVQLPFLQSMLTDFRVLPIVVGDCPPEPVAALLDALWGGPETLVVISTDLSHFHDYASAERIDQRSCQRILARDSDLRGDDACGCRPLNGLMRSRHAAALDIELLGRCNSGDSGGDRERVVGYAAFSLH